MGDVNHVFSEMSCCLVVFSMCYLPREVRDEEEGMKNPADKIVKFARGGKGLMTTFMTQNPNSRSNTSLCKSINHPTEESKGRIREEGNRVVCRECS